MSCQQLRRVLPNTSARHVMSRLLSSTNFPYLQGCYCSVSHREGLLPGKRFFSQSHKEADWNTYVQGQAPEPRVREYFYFVDHQGRLFLDDARMKNFTSCFKEVKFLEFFFRRLRLNESGRYETTFPFLSLCGRERNFVRCDDLPVVFTRLFQDEKGQDRLEYAHAVGSAVMTMPFQPSLLCVPPHTGRLYHPAPQQLGGVGLVRSSLAEQLEPNFVAQEGQQPPRQFRWKGKLHSLSHELLSLLDTLPRPPHLKE